MNKLSIRFKMMLWYTLLTTCLLSLFIPVLYSIISNSQYKNEESRIRSAMAQIALEVEVENDTLIWNEKATLPTDMYITVIATNNNVLYDNSKSLEFSKKPFANGQIRIINENKIPYMVFDQGIKNEDVLMGYIRVYSSLKNINEYLIKIKFFIAISAIIYLFVAIFGSLFIAKQAIKPISKITKTAKAIQNGDLSLRILGLKANDEVGELANTFNSMIEHLDISFHRERRFASDASHELRTPVAIVMAYAEALIAEQSTGEDTLKTLVIIKKESEKMNKIISELLTLTRGYEGKYKLALENVDINEIIENVIEQLEECADDANITLINLTDKTLFSVVDQSLITQMLLNLIENSIKYGKNGGKVKVSAVKIGKGCEITVVDDGVGIDKSDIPHIFDRFYRVDKSRDRSGTGLGLSIVKWIVEEHKGQISVESEINKGTKFIIQV